MEQLRYVGFGLCPERVEPGTILDGIVVSWPFILLVLAGVAIMIAAARTIQSKPLRYGVMLTFALFTFVAGLALYFVFNIGMTCLLYQ